MDNEGQMNPKELQIQGLLDRFLRVHAAQTGFENDSEHLDDDTLSAFVEGNLSEREAEPLVRHLVECSFCRHVTAELIKLDLAFAADAQPHAVADASTEPTKVADVLSGILTRIFGNNDGAAAVFAHQETDEKTPAEAKREKEE